MPDRPFVLLSAAMSVDGCIDDTSSQRLVLSDAADLDRVDAERAGVDAVLVGATTIRRDDPRLLLRSVPRQEARVAAGRPPHPIKVALTGGGDLDPTARFFTTGSGLRLVYAPSAAVGLAAERVGSLATVVDAGERVDPAWLLADLHARGVARLMIEGGTSVHALFLTAGLVDEIQLLVAPFFVGEAAAPRFGGTGAFPHNAGHRMRLAEARVLGDQVLLRYLLGESDG
ncbi:RibD family protein [Pseudonocardia sp. GCM10023141]|uniref:RibD family protein n=1 Tax=Pseudonocardia sp. GCM10023141 TaxID=3252653 RepID=UPI0036144A07